MCVFTVLVYAYVCLCMRSFVHVRIYIYVCNCVRVGIRMRFGVCTKMLWQGSKIYWDCLKFFDL